MTKDLYKCRSLYIIAKNRKTFKKCIKIRNSYDKICRKASNRRRFLPIKKDEYTRARITDIMGTMLCLAHYMLCSLAFGRSEHLILKFSNGISRLRQRLQSHIMTLFTSEANKIHWVDDTL